MGKIVRKHYDLIFGAAFFISYKFYFVYLLFKERLVPPEPDDSYSYLFYAKNIINLDSFEQFRSLLYSVWLNILNLISGSFEKTFLFNFYAGTAVLFLGLYIFLKRLENNKFQRIILLLVLALYSGTGAYHGFYWVGPSFYLVILFFLIVADILKGKFNLTIVALLSFFFIFIHPSSVFILFVFPIWGLILLFKKKAYKEQIKLCFTYLFTGLTIYLLYIFISINLPKEQVIVSPEGITSTLKEFLAGNFNLISWPVIYREYFSFIIINPLIAAGFLVAVAFSIKLKGLRFISLYLAVLILVLFSSIVPFGYRTLEILWPLTFIILGYGLIGIFNLLSNCKRYLSWIALSASFSLFALVATNFNIIWISSINAKSNYSWDRSCSQEFMNTYLEEPLIFAGWDSFFAFQLYDLPAERTKIFKKGEVLKRNQLIVLTNQSYNFSYNPQLSNFQKRLTTVTREGNYPSNNIENYYWYNLATVEGSNLDGKVVMDCGYFKVFQVQ